MINLSLTHTHTHTHTLTHTLTNKQTNKLILVSLLLIRTTLPFYSPYHRNWRQKITKRIHILLNISFRKLIKLILSNCKSESPSRTIEQSNIGDREGVKC